MGLSRLSGASFKECAFWVFGYWLVAGLTLIILARARSVWLPLPRLPMVAVGSVRPADT